MSTGKSSVVWISRDKHTLADIEVWSEKPIQTPAGWDCQPPSPARLLGVMGRALKCIGFGVAMGKCKKVRITIEEMEE